MGSNSSRFDSESYYASLSVKQLESRLQKANDFVAKYPKFRDGFHNEYIQQLKMKIAERIGSK